MYAVILSYQQYPELRQLDNAHAFVMQRLRAALANLRPSVQYQGTCDLTIGDRKISGNSLRCKRHHLLYHGTILYDFPLSMISACLRTPPRQPAYRRARSHESFLANLHLPVAKIRDSIVQAWDARELADTWPQQATQTLVEQQYSRDDWNFRL
jgi:lipoate-protein ligase A